MPKPKDIHARIEERIARMTMLDDAFMTAVLDDNIEGTQIILRTILGKPSLCVVSQRVQRALKNLEGRTSVLDVFATDETGAYYDIEVQNASSGASPRRARYHASLMDTHEFPVGAKYDELRESYVIFITRDDVMGGNCPLYCFERMETSTNVPFNDGSHIVYVNGQYDDEGTDLGKLIADFKTSEPATMHFEALAARAERLKQGSEGIDIMGKFWEDIYNEAAAEGRAEGLAEGRAEGRAEGVSEGFAKGSEEASVEVYVAAAMSAANRLDVEIAEALEIVGVPDSLRDSVLQRL